MTGFPIIHQEARNRRLAECEKSLQGLQSRAAQVCCLIREMMDNSDATKGPPSLFPFQTPADVAADLALILEILEPEETQNNA